MSDHAVKKFKALPVQVIEVDRGIILKRGCTEVKIGGEGVVEAIQVILTATSDSGKTREEICGLFAGTSRQMVEQLIEHLISRCLLLPAEGIETSHKSGENTLDLFYWHVGDTALQATERLNKRHIVILGINYISRQLAASLTASGVENFQVVDEPLLRNLRLFDNAGRPKIDAWPASSKPPLNFKHWEESADAGKVDCLVATSDFGGHRLMRKWNTFGVDHRYCFLPVVLSNMIGYVGPLVIPGETACFECLLVRQNAHLKDLTDREAIDNAAFDGQKVVGFHPSMASILGDLAAFELIKHYGGTLPMRNVGTLIEVNLLASQIRPRKVLKVPRCAVCSSLNARPSANPNKSGLGPVNRVNE